MSTSVTQNLKAYWELVKARQLKEFLHERGKLHGLLGETHRQLNSRKVN